MPEKRLYIKTFGCQMNEYDSEKMRSLLAAEYGVAAETPEDADLVIVNTCSVREKGEQKLFSLLGRLRDLKESNPGLIIGVGGCVAQQEGEAILKRSRAVDFVVGTHNLSLIPGIVRQVRNGAPAQVAVDYREEWEDLPIEFNPIARGQSVVKSPNLTPVRALVSIQRGCNKNCSYCVVPTTRGPELSRSAQEIEREVRAKVRTGAREVMLLGQTVNSWGRDLTPRQRFSELIERLSQVEDLLRIRFTSPHPQEVREDFIRLYADHPKLARHIHLPVQSGNDRVLRLMNRNYRIDRYREIVRELRSACADIALSTDIIVGFTTETEEEFQDTLNLLEEVRYESVYYFKYSRRPNTRAVSQFQPEEELPAEVVDERFLRLDRLQKRIGFEENSKHVGRVAEVLVEGISPADNLLLRGRNSQNIIVEFAGDAALVGELSKVKIERVGSHHLYGSIVSGD